VDVHLLGLTGKEGVEVVEHPLRLEDGDLGHLLRVVAGEALQVLDLHARSLLDGGPEEG